MRDDTACVAMDRLRSGGGRTNERNNRSRWALHSQHLRDAAAKQYPTLSDVQIQLLIFFNIFRPGRCLCATFCSLWAADVPIVFFVASLFFDPFLASFCSPCR